MLFNVAFKGVRIMTVTITPLLLFAVTVLLLPEQASASVASAPEPFSLALLATGIAGFGAAEVIRRRKNK